LPLRKDLRKIAVIGPNADSTRLGDYADVAIESSEYGMLSQIKKIVSPATDVLYASGANISSAVALAKNAEIVVMGLGEKKGISGEDFDRSNLDLPGNQAALLEAVAATGVPVVLVLQNGRPLTIPWAAEHVPAILETWYAGEFGGRAIAETLFGDNNPAGRLSISFPKRVGQLPVFYNHLNSRKSTGYIDGDDLPQFAFGYGLSYTTFKYENLRVTASAPGNDDVQVSFDLRNTGRRDGDEVAQVYVHTATASVAMPVKELKCFSRVHLRAGETQHLTLRIRKADLAIWGVNRTWNIEPGEYTIYVGGNSEQNSGVKFTLGEN
jgi:beta-glucosidase